MTLAVNRARSARGVCAILSCHRLRGVPVLARRIDTRVFLQKAELHDAGIQLGVLLPDDRGVSTGTTRQQRFDQQRLEDLRTIYREIQSLCRDPDIKDKLNRPLPKTIDELAALARHRRTNTTDPETGQPYLYTVKNETTYELCATFSLKRDADTQVFWNHPAGKYCFTIDAFDPP